MTRRCLCPGSFDPVTNGHLDIIARAAELFDEVIVAVLHNPAKAGSFDVVTRVGFIEDALAQSGPYSAPVRVVTFAGQLLIDVCAQVGADAIVKGLRGASDYSYETPMARMNRHLSGVETVFLAGDPTWEHVSSSLVREVAAGGADVTGMVPEVVRTALMS